jgi:hypothetical protein
VRTSATIYAEDALIDAEGYVLQSEEEPAETEDSDDLVSQFRDFIDGISPEDFES